MPSPFSDARPFREKSQLNGFSGNRIERHAEARDEEGVAAALGKTSARFYLFAEERALLALDSGALHPLFARREAEALGLDGANVVLLGTADGAPRLAGRVANRDSLPDTIKAIDLRSLAVQGAVSAEDLGALAQARSLLHWHATHGFCSRCGAPTVMCDGGLRRQCMACGTAHFPRVDPVAIMLAIDGERCVLGRQARFAPGMFSALAGFIEPGETIEDAVRREIKEEAGIAIGRVTYYSSQPWPFPSSLMIGAHAEAVTTELAPDELELEDCRWFERGEVKLMLEGRHPDGLVTPPNMAIAHRLIEAFVEAG